MINGDKCLPPETRKVSNKQPNFTPEETRRRRTNEALELVEARK